MALTKAQIGQLLKPINPSRVLKDNNGMSHVSQQDVTAHLSRMFGFTGWDKFVTFEVVFERENPKNRLSKPDNPKVQNGWDVAYRAKCRLVIKDPDGNVVKTGEDASIGSAQNQPSLADAHDLALKSAISLSMKRAAKDLGDQFGLSLYNKGQVTALVMKSIAYEEQATEDVQEGVPEQTEDAA